MFPTNAINKFLVDRYCFENNINYQVFCENAKIELDDLLKFFQSDFSLELKVFFRIARCINANVYELIKNFTEFYDAN